MSLKVRVASFVASSVLNTRYNHSIVWTVSVYFIKVLSYYLLSEYSWHFNHCLQLATLFFFLNDPPPPEIYPLPLPDPLPISPLRPQGTARAGQRADLPGDGRKALHLMPRGTASAGGQLRQPLALAAQERSEAESVVQLRQRRHVGQAAPEPGGRDLEREIAGDAREPAGEIHRLAMRTKARPQGSRAAQLQVRHPRQVAVQLIERAEGAHEAGGGAMPDAPHAGNVVHLIAGEREIVGEALRSHAEMPLDVVIAELLARAEVPEQIPVAHQLRQVLVAGDEGRAHPLPAHQL